MKAIIIAAGRGKRMGSLTDNRPKCLLPVNDTTILDNTLHHFRALGINEIAIIKGYQADKINVPNVHYFLNDNYPNNNILHSLMQAASFMDDDIIISYSDIWLSSTPIRQLINTERDCVISVDSDWQKNYIGRTHHPLSEAENVIYNSLNQATILGKHIDTTHMTPETKCGEFIGLFKLSKQFCRYFVETFNALNQTLKPDTPFQFSKTWHNAYITDFLNELIDRNQTINCSLHQGGWQEIDTLQDYQMLLNKVSEEESYVI